jgi:diacylglycerol O-acyltransferase
MMPRGVGRVKISGMSERLSPIEAIMWRAGQDPTLRMTVGNILMLDRAPDRDALIDRLTDAAAFAPRLRVRLDDPSRLRTRPSWVDDQEFDAEEHLRVMAVPSPGSERQLLDLVALVEAAPFDPGRSPWDVTVIEGLANNRAALYLRADHVLTDGMAGRELVMLLLDDLVGSDESPPPPPATTEQAPPPTPAAEPTSGRRPGTVTLTFDLTTVARPVVAGIAAARSTDPVDTVVRGVQRSIDAVSSVSRQLLVPGGALSPLVPSGSLATRFEMLSVAGARTAAIGLGGSRNVLLVAAAADGLGAYHERLGLPVHELRMAMPMLLRHDGSAGGNSFVPLRVELPTSASHPGPQFGVVAERLARARREPATRLATTLSTAISMMPPRALLPAVHAQLRTVDFIATALPGLRGTGTICGAVIEASYPFGPRAGRLLNITGLGNGDRLDLGLAIDPVAIDEPDVLVECLEAAFARFISDAGQPAAGG